jgi:hypothetical protein
MPTESKPHRNFYLTGVANRTDSVLHLGLVRFFPTKCGIYATLNPRHYRHSAGPFYGTLEVAIGRPKADIRTSLSIPSASMQLGGRGAECAALGHDRRDQRRLSGILGICDGGRLIISDAAESAAGFLSRGGLAEKQRAPVSQPRKASRLLRYL